MTTNSHREDRQEEGIVYCTAHTLTTQTPHNTQTPHITTHEHAHSHALSHISPHTQCVKTYSFGNYAMPGSGKNENPFARNSFHASNAGFCIPHVIPNVWEKKRYLWVSMVEDSPCILSLGWLRNELTPTRSQQEILPH